MENGDQKKKLNFKHILFLTSLGLLIVMLKYFLIRGNTCHDTCQNINSELDVIKCLDACSINAEDYREPISYIKIVLYSSVIIIFFLFLFRYINNYDRRNTNNAFLRFLQWMKKLKDSLINREKKDENKYRKIE